MDEIITSCTLKMLKSKESYKLKFDKFNLFIFNCFRFKN